MPVKFCLSEHPRGDYVDVSEEAIRLQLLANLAQICDNLTALNRAEEAAWLDQQVSALSGISLGNIRFVEDAIHLISHVFFQTDASQRGRVFAGYKRVARLPPGFAYAPKAEVHYFGEQIEPLILKVVEDTPPTA